MIQIEEQHRFLLKIAREAGDRYFDASTQRVLISRDTLWYAIGLLFDESGERQALGRSLLSQVQSEDGTHTPATMLAVLHGVPELLDDGIKSFLQNEIERELVHAAGVVWRDGNVNHPLGAWATLVCGGELCGQEWAVELGLRRLKEFQQTIGDRRFRYRRQAEMSEYNSLTYTALDLCFLALVAEYAREPDARNLAGFLENRLWLDVAMHFHSPSQQFAGPHSRSYQEDSAGGFSALHGVMLAAGFPIFCEPSLSLRFSHPSTPVQAALTAIIPFHITPDVRQMALDKPFPYTLRMTTYAEHYHENSSRPSSPGGGGRSFAFDDEVYPGGWSDLTTHMTEEYALGTASLPYVNAGHADSIMVRIRRGTAVRGMEDFRSIYARGVFNGAQVHQRNDSHVAGTTIDESYLYEEGRCVTYQHKGLAIVAYTPKRAGHVGVRSFRTDCLIGYWTPFDRVWIDDEEVTALPVRAHKEARLIFQDFQTYGVVIPLGPNPASDDLPITLRREKEFLLLSMSNYDGPVRDFERDEITRWQSGFYLELATLNEFGSVDDFKAHARSIQVTDTWREERVRRVDVGSGGHRMVLEYDPFSERILHRLWDGSADEVMHFAVEAPAAVGTMFTPTTLFGSEAMQRRI